MIDIDTTIHYIFAIPDSELKNFTLFQGFSPGMIEITAAFRALSEMPIDLQDPVVSKFSRMVRRMAGHGAWHWMVLNASTTPHIPISVERPFWVTITQDQTTAESIGKWAATIEFPPLHVSLDGVPDAISLQDFNQDTLALYVQTTLDRLQPHLPVSSLLIYRSLVDAWRPFERETLNLVRKSHPMTFPNHFVAESLGFRFSSSENFQTGEENDYPTVMAESAHTILDIRDRIPPVVSDLTFPRLPALILHAPAENRAATARPIGSNADPDSRALFDLQMMFRRQKGFLVPQEKLQRFADNMVAIGGFELRRRELAVYSHLVALRAASTVAATVRVTPAINRVFSTVAALGNHTRSQAPVRPARLRRLLDTIQARLRSAVGDEAMAVIERSGQTGIKLISDAPLEWLPVRGLPIGIRYDVSRVGATPGNHMAQQMFLNRPIRFSPDDLRSVLVITSYEKGDHLRGILTERLNAISPAWEGKLSLEIVRVETLDEFRDALACFDGHILIFDGHGDHPEGDQTFGTLRIAGKPIDIWDHRGTFRVPPIVILSACDTHGADRNHNTAANGFLACGAVTVLATLLPVNANDAAGLIARLLFRVAFEIEPVINLTGQVLLWSGIVGGMLRLKMSSEIINAFFRADRISMKCNDKMQEEAYIRVNRCDEDWYEWLLAEVSARSGLDTGQVDAIASEAIAASDAIRYIQMGNPESITVGLEEHLPDRIKSALLKMNEDLGRV